MRILNLIFSCVLAIAAMTCAANAIGEKALNDQVRAQLSAAGDNGAKPRLVTHWAYPERGRKSVSRKAAKKFLQKRGYQVRNAATDGGVMFEKVQTPADRTFDKETQLLRDSFAASGWFYDGWETFAVRE